MKRKHTAIVAVAALCLAAGALPARADNLLIAKSSFPQFWTGNVDKQLLVNDGATALLFSVPVTGSVSFTYTAECRLNADTGSYLVVAIFVDNVKLIPTGNGDAFCSGRSGTVGGGAARRSMTASRTLFAGTHQIRIGAVVGGPHLGASIRASTLVVAQ